MIIFAVLTILLTLCGSLRVLCGVKLKSFLFLCCGSLVVFLSGLGLLALVGCSPRSIPKAGVSVNY